MKFKLDPKKELKGRNPQPPTRRLPIIFMKLTLLPLLALYGCVTEAPERDIHRELTPDASNETDEAVLSVRRGEKCEKVVESVRKHLSDQGLSEETENDKDGSLTIRFVKEALLGDDEITHSLAFSDDESQARRIALTTGGQLGTCSWETPAKGIPQDATNTKATPTKDVKKPLDAGTGKKPPRTTSFMIITNH